MVEKSDYLLSEYFTEWPPESKDAVEDAFNEAAKVYHPDHGGSTDEFIQIQKERHRLKRISGDDPSIDDWIGVSDVIRSVWEEGDFIGDYNIQIETSGIMGGVDQWSGRLKDRETGLRIQLDIDLPFDIEYPLEFRASYHDDKLQTIETIEGRTMELSDFMDSNDLSLENSYKLQIKDIGNKVLSYADDEIRPQL